MMLRWLVSNWMRQAAHEQLRGAVSEAMPGGGESDTIETPLPPIDVAVLFALNIESGGLVDLLQNCQTTRYASHTEHRGELNGRQLLIAESGVGQEAAGSVTADLINMHHPNWMISAGFAGALQPALKRGHILMVDEVVDVTGKKMAIGLTVDEESVKASSALHLGRLLTVDKLLRTRSQKESLGAEHDASACDMETLAIAEACQQMNTKLLSIRIISDSLNDELPQEIERMMTQDSLVGKLGAATGAIFKRPSSVKDMWKLREDALKATDRLARFLVGVIDQLPNTESENSP